jgi:Glycosyltransferase family 87
MAESHGLDGINPYVYLPFTGLVMTPVSHFPFPQSARLWFGISHAALLLAIALTGVHLTGKRWWHAPWTIALGILIAALMMPLYRQSTAGQLNGVLALALAIILVSLEHRWHWLAGLAIAFAALFKLSPGLFILWLLWRRAWRPLAWTAGWLALLTLWSLWQVGLSLHLEFLPLLADMRIGHSTWAHRGMTFHFDPANQAMGSFLLHVLAGAGDTQPWLNLGEGVANGLTMVFSLGVLGVIIFATRRGWGDSGPEPEALRLEWALVVLASLLIPSLLWDHYVVQLLPVLMVLIWGMWMTGDTGLPGKILLSALWVAAAVLLTVWISHWSESRRQGLGLLTMSIRLWGVLLLFGIALAERLRTDRRPA